MSSHQQWDPLYGHPSNPSLTPGGPPVGTKVRMGTSVSKSTVGSLRTGIYSRFYTDEEMGLPNHLNLIEEELKLCRIRLRRVVDAEARQFEMDKALAAARKDRGLDLDEITIEEGGFLLKSGKKIKSPTITKKRFKRTDYNDICDRLLARVESLEKTRHWITNNNAVAYPDGAVPITQIEVVVVTGKVRPESLVIEAEPAGE